MLIINQEIRSELQRFGRELLYSKGGAFINSDNHIRPLAPSRETV